MYGIQATAEVDIGSALHVPEVPPEVKHSYNPCHYEELCSHYHSSRHFVWTEHENMDMLLKPSHQYFTQQHHSTNCVFAVRAQCNASLKVCLSCVTAKKNVFSTW